MRTDWIFRNPEVTTGWLNGVMVHWPRGWSFFRRRAGMTLQGNTFRCAAPRLRLPCAILFRPERGIVFGLAETSKFAV